MFALCIRIILLALCIATPVIVGAPPVAVLAFPVMALLGSFQFCMTALVVLGLSLRFYFPYYSAFTPVALLLLLVAGLYAIAGKLRPNDSYGVFIKHFAWLLRPACFLLYLIIGIYCLRRDADFALSFTLLFLVSLFHFQHKSLRVSLRKTVFAEALLLIAALVVGMSIIEGGARLRFGAPPGNRDFYRAHPEYIFLLNPGGQTTYPVYVDGNTFPEITFTVSEQGFRDRVIPPKKPDEYRVLLIGDSFTMGSAVEKDQTIAAWLQACFRRKNPEQLTAVINGGMNAAGPLQALGMLRERGFPLAPNVVILQLFLYNDFDDSLITIGKAQRTFYAEFRPQVEIFMKQNTVPYWIENKMIQWSSAYRNLLTGPRAQPWIGDTLSKSWLFTKAQRVQRMPVEPDIPSYLDINRQEWYPELIEGKRLLLSFVEEMHNHCMERGIDFHVYCIPHYREVCSKSWNASVAMQQQLDVVRYKAIHVVEEGLATLGIPHFSILDLLQQHEDRIEDVYYIYDGHFTPFGNDIVARRIYEYLAENGQD